MYTYMATSVQPELATVLPTRRGMNESPRFSIENLSGEPVADHQSPTSNYNIMPGSRIKATYSCRQTIDLSVTLTTHHNGHFQFKVCPISPGQAATQACFDAHNVKFISGHVTSFDPNFSERACIPLVPPGTQASNDSGLYKYQ
jgi:hypothetical protein